MDNLENKIERRYRRRGNNVWVGLLILAIGSVFLAREMGVILPDWLFTWPMIVIAAGLFIGITNKFRDFGWLIMVAVGVFFLADDVVADFSFRRYVWPLTIIIIGLVVIMLPFQRRRLSRFRSWTDDSNQNPQPVEGAPLEPGTTEDVLEVVAIFGGAKRNIYSKSFRGGEIVTIFGGTEINLTHADFPGKEVRIEGVQIFGGTKLIVPANWNVRQEAVAIFGGIEDKRPQPTGQPEKTVVLEGFVMFGGIEIRSY